MMPFGGFMQAVVVTPPANTLKTAGMANIGDSVAGDNDPFPVAQDNTDTFSAWVRALMENADTGFDNHGSHERRAADKVGSTTGDQDADLVEPDGAAVVSQDVGAFPMAYDTDIPDDHSIVLVEGSNAVQSTLDSHPEGPGGVGPTERLQRPVVGRAAHPTENRHQRQAAGGQVQAPDGTKQPSIGSPQAETLAKDSGLDSGRVHQHGMATTVDAKAAITDDKSAPTMGTVEPARPTPDGKTVVQADPRAASGGNTVTPSEESLLAAAMPRRPIQTDNVKRSAAAPKDAAPGAIRPTSRPDAAVTVNPPPSAEDGGPHLRDSANGELVLRNDTAPLDENQWRNGQAADTARSSSVDAARSQATVQDVVRSEISAKAPASQAQAAPRMAEFADKQLSTSVMDQIVDKANLRTIRGRSEIQIRLKPEFLGNVHMNIATERQQVVVRVLTDQPMVKDIIDTHLHQLKTELQHQGLTIDKFEVVVNPDADPQHQREQFAQSYKPSSYQNGRRQSQKQGQGAPQQDTQSQAADDDSTDGDRISYFA